MSASEDSLTGDEFGKRADAEIISPRIDLVADLELLRPGADLHHHPGHVVAQNEWHAIAQDQLELATPDLGVEQVHASSVHFHQHLVIAQCGYRHVGQLQRALLAVSVEHEGLHVSASLEHAIHRPVDSI